MLKLVLVALSLFLTAFPNSLFAHSPDATAPTAIAAHDRVAQDSTVLLISARDRYGRSAAGEQGQRMTDLVAAAQSRHEALLAIVDSDPEEVLRVTLPAEIRAAFPPQAQRWLEREADEEGTLEIYHVDHVDPVLDRYEYILQTATERLSLHFAGKAPQHATGTRLRIRGVKIGAAVVVADETAATVMAAVATLGNTLGMQRTLAILVNFSNAPTQPFTLAYAQSMMFATTSDYDYEASYQQTSLTGAVAGWFTIAETNQSCNYGNIASQAKQAAAAAGFVLSSYNRYVYVFPANGCSWWGLGTIGGNPSQAWIHSKFGFTLSVVGHEMGHNFGLYHSHSLDCGSVSVASSGCSASEYGDIFDMMGSSHTTPHFNAYQKERLGWLNAGVSPPITTVAATAGTTLYTIAPIEDARNSVPRALKIPLATSCAASREWLYVESRQAKGFDAFLATNPTIQQGVLVHRVTDGDANSSYLLDMTAATTAWSDAALVAGQTFTDPLTGISVQPVSVGSASSTLAVTFPGATCAHVAPKVTMTPAGTVYALPGSSVSYTVAVQNNDGCACGASTFDVGAAVPVGWSATTTRTAGIVPGGVGLASLIVTAPDTATVAFYPVTASAANVGAPTSVGSVAGTIAITTSEPLTTVASTDKATYTLSTKGTNVNITTRVTSGGTAVAGALVSVQVSDPAGAITTLSGKTDSHGSSKLKYVLKAPASKAGVYAVTSTAIKGSTSSTATTSFVAN